MDGVRDFFISGVIHKAFIDVRQQGAEAAATNAVAPFSIVIPPFHACPFCAAIAIGPFRHRPLLGDSVRFSLVRLPAPHARVFSLAKPLTLRPWEAPNSQAICRPLDGNPQPHRD